MSARNTVHWHCVTIDQFLWEHWDDESLLYDCRSGQTHSLTPLATEVILLLEKHSLSAEAITERLNRMFDNALDAEEIKGLLDHFDALGLTEECPQQV